MSPRWVAGRDGTAHLQATTTGRSRALCGVRSVDERFAHPATTKCLRCRELEDYGPTSAMSERELIAAYGGLPIAD